MVLYYFVYAITGKILIYLFQLFPLSEKIGKKFPVMQKMFQCDLCLGVWMYFFLAIIMRMSLFYFIDESYGTLQLLIEYFMTGAVTSFLVHLVSLGWNDKFRIYEVK